MKWGGAGAKELRAFRAPKRAAVFLVERFDERVGFLVTDNDEFVIDQDGRGAGIEVRFSERLTPLLLAIEIIRNDGAKKHVNHFSIGDRRWGGSGFFAQIAFPENTAVL